MCSACSLNSELLIYEISPELARYWNFDPSSYYFCSAQFSLPLTLHRLPSLCSSFKRGKRIRNSEKPTGQQYAKEPCTEGEISKAKMLITATLSYITYCLQLSLGEWRSRGSQPGGLAEPAQASPLIKVFIPFCHVINWPLRPIFQPMPASEKNALRQSFCGHVPTTLSFPNSYELIASGFYPQADKESWVRPQHYAAIIIGLQGAQWDCCVPSGIIHLYNLNHLSNSPLGFHKSVTGILSHISAPRRST